MKLCKSSGTREDKKAWIKNKSSDLIQKKTELWSVNHFFFTMFSLIDSPAAPHHQGNLIHAVLMSESSESLVCPTDV